MRIKMIIDLLQSNDWYKSGENIEVAKGKHEIADTFKKGKIKIQRSWQLKKR